MRHIKKSDVLGHIKEAWLTEAQNALSELKKKPADERGSYIATQGKVWSQFKEALSRVSHEKCWYSEARIAPSELEMDHFRPKNKVSGSLEPHAGYWWLAFDWNNFRLAYSLINKRRRDTRVEDVQGKGCYFPLVDENVRVPDTHPADTTPEFPTLIDPYKKSDVQLLDYAVEEGKVIERYSMEEHEVRHKRAKRSIELYHLNEGTLIRDRQELQVLIGHFVKNIERLAVKKEQEGILSDAEEREYDDQIDQLGNLINSASKFSSFARSCVKQYGDRGWNTELLTSS